MTEVLQSRTSEPSSRLARIVLHDVSIGVQDLHKDPKFEAMRSEMNRVFGYKKLLAHDVITLASGDSHEDITNWEEAYRVLILEEATRMTGVNADDETQLMSVKPWIDACHLDNGLRASHANNRLRRIMLSRRFPTPDGRKIFVADRAPEVIASIATDLYLESLNNQTEGA